MISVFFGLKLASRSSECSIEFCKQTKSDALTLEMKVSYSPTPRRVLYQIMGYIYRDRYNVYKARKSSFEVK